MKKITQEDVDEAWEEARKDWEDWDKARKAWVKARKAWDKAWDEARNKAIKLEKKFKEQEGLEDE